MLKNVILSLRPKQWVKNLFIFLPLIFGKKLTVYPAYADACLAFVLFCITSGVIYIINDIADISEDRVHPEKRSRPIASGALGVGVAKGAALVLGVVSVVGSFTLNINFGWIIVAYIALNLAYSALLKDVVIIDVFCIGAFYLMRIAAGCVVAVGGISHWIIIMTVLLALFLGFNKRRQELTMLEAEANKHRSVLAKYNLYFIDQMISVVTSSIVVAYMLYTVDARTVREFGSTNLILSLPFVYYGIFRYLYLIHKACRDEDPTVILLSDRMLQIDIILWIMVSIAVIYF